MISLWISSFTWNCKKNHYHCFKGFHQFSKDFMRKTPFRDLPKNFYNLLYSFKKCLNTQYATDSYFIDVLKMEYVYKINIFGLKMMVKSGLEKIFMKSLHAQSLFRKIFFYFIEKGGFLHKILNWVIKIAHGWISIKLFVMYVQCTYHKWDFKPQISSIFNFEYVNKVWISGVLGVKRKTWYDFG